MKGATVDDVSARPSRESLATIRSGVEFPRCGGIQGEQRRTGVDGCSPEPRATPSPGRYQSPRQPKSTLAALFVSFPEAAGKCAHRALPRRTEGPLPRDIPRRVYLLFLPP